MFGPHRLKKDGDPTDRNFAERSPFWEAYRLWVGQGRKVGNDRITCVWRPAIPMIVQRVGNMTFTIQKGEPNAYGATQQITLRAPKPINDD